MKETMRDLTTDELENVSGGIQMGNLPSVITFPRPELYFRIVWLAANFFG
jgi:hypothetical protein